MMTTFIPYYYYYYYYYYCSLNESSRKKDGQICTHTIGLKFKFTFALYIYILRCHTSRFFLNILLHNRYRKENLISRSIISSVSDNDIEALLFPILLNLNRYAHSHVYIYI